MERARSREGGGEDADGRRGRGEARMGVKRYEGGMWEKRRDGALWAWEWGGGTRKQQQFTKHPSAKPGDICAPKLAHQRLARTFEKKVLHAKIAKPETRSL